MYNKIRTLLHIGEDMLNFIVNPHAKFARKTAEELKARLCAQETPYAIEISESREELRARARELSDAGETVIAVGGDGTLNDVLSSIDPEKCVLGLVPAGTGNDFAVAANIPFGAAALDLILGGTPVETDFIDCGEGLRSMNIAGLGIDVDVLERCYRMKRGSDRGKYFRGLISSLMHYRGQRVEVCADGEKFSFTAFIAAVCNGTQFGGGIPLCPPASLGDGKLDLILARQPKRWKIPYYLVKLMHGKAPQLKIVKHILCEEAEIVQTDGESIQLDGELLSSKKLTARVVHGKLKMYRG